jgi:FixJ family two-component response regulator
MGTPVNERIVIHILDENSARRASLARMTFDAGHHAEIYSSLDELLDHAPDQGLLIMHDDNTAASVVSLIVKMAEHGQWLPVIGIADAPTTAAAVMAIKAGAIDYTLPPLSGEAFGEIVVRAAKEGDIKRVRRMRALDARRRIARLSVREREVLECLAEGQSNKEIGRALEISPRTVEIHRTKLMGKLGLHHATEAVRMRFEAGIAKAA